MSRLDQAAKDGAETLVRIAQLYTLPDFVKNAELDSLRRTDLSMGNYADARRPYQFPCDSPAATIVSYAFFLNKEAAINPKVRPLIQDRLDAFVNRWGVKRAVDKLKSDHLKIAQTNPCPDHEYALVQVIGDRKDQRYPLRNPSEVKAAAEWFDRNLALLRDTYDLQTRQKMAKQILRQASRFNVTLGAEHATLEKAAGYGMQAPSSVVRQIELRLKLGHNIDPVIREQMTKLAESVSSQPRMVLEQGMAIKLAETLEDFDREFRLSTKYDSLLLSPEDTVFGIQIKQAQEYVNSCCATVSGSVYDKQSFRKLSLTDVREAFGDDTANSVRKGLFVDPEKMAEVAEMLPLPDAKMLDAIMSGAGEVPIEKVAAREVRTTRNDFAALALSTR